MHPPESRLVDLAMGLLSSDEADATRDHIRHCAECESRFRVIVADRESLRAGPVPTLVNGHIHLDQRAAGTKKWVRVGLVAAVLTVAAVSVFRLAVQERFPQYWIPVTDDTAVVWRADGDSNRVMDQFEAYQNQDAAAAVDELRALTPDPSNYTASTLRDLYLASALTNAGRPTEALELLDPDEINVLPTPWRFHAQWVRYLALQRADRDADAKAWLEKLAAEEPGETGEKARDELRRIR